MPTGLFKCFALTHTHKCDTSTILEPVFTFSIKIYEQSDPNINKCYLSYRRIKGYVSPQLSPVLESNLSDNSASDYQLAHIADTLSPFSSSSSASSSGLFPLQLKGQTQLFPLQLRGQTQPQRSPRPWGATSKKAQVLSSSHGECRCSVYLDVALCSALQFRPYSHPSGMRESPPGGAVPAGPPRYHQTPSLSTVLFGSTGSE